MTVQYGDNCTCWRRIYEHVERFKDWQTSTDKLTGTCVEVKNQIEQSIWDS